MIFITHCILQIGVFAKLKKKTAKKVQLIHPLNGPNLHKRNSSQKLVRVSGQISEVNQP